MNKAILVGNLTRDPERRTTPQGTSVTTFTVAVQKRFKNQQTGAYDSDFINCVAWRSTADFIAQYFQKGSRIGIVGSIQTRSYDDKNGNKRYVTEVVVDEAEFCGSKNNSDNRGYSRPQESQVVPEPQPDADDIFGEELSGFQTIDDSELPF